MAPPHQPRDTTAGLALRLAAIVLVAAVLAGAGSAVGGNASALAAPCPTAPGTRPDHAGRTPSRPAAARPTSPPPADPGSPSTPPAASAGPSTTPSTPPPVNPPPGNPLPGDPPPGNPLPGNPPPGDTQSGAPAAGADVPDGALRQGAVSSSVRRAAAAAPDGPGAPAPSTGPAPSASAAPSGSAEPSGTPEPSASAGPSDGAGPSGSPSPVASDVPCLGPRVNRIAPTDEDRPRAALGRGILTGASLEMHKSVYRGVTRLDVDGGTVRALQFDMATAVTEPFRLVAPAPQGRTVVTTSSSLTISGHVQFFTTKFTGKLFGLIPVTFTPDLPPPLTPPEMWFTDVVIELALVRCDKLDADHLDLRLGTAS